jgi:hypothetical protein
MTPPGIDPATFWFVAQCLNHCATMCPIITMDIIQIWANGNHGKFNPDTVVFYQLRTASTTPYLNFHYIIDRCWHFTFSWKNLKSCPPQVLPLLEATYESITKHWNSNLHIVTRECVHKETVRGNSAVRVPVNPQTFDKKSCLWYQVMLKTYSVAAS